MTRLKQPVSEGELHSVEIEKYGDGGDGLAYIDGLVVFVEGADPGDEPLVRIIHVGETFARAEFVG